MLDRSHDVGPQNPFHLGAAGHEGDIGRSQRLLIRHAYLQKVGQMKPPI